MYTHVAYGLGLSTSMRLPGMPSGSPEGLPSLALELVTQAELESAWSGSEARQAWIGRLGDGCTLTIDHGSARDVLFSYGERARFRLDSAHARLECAPLSAGLHWQQVLLGRVLPNVAIIRGYEALHASAVDSPAGVVAVAAPSGTGKTTLALELLRRGWPLFADDVLTLGDGPEAGVWAYPGTPHMNVAEPPAGADPPAQSDADLGTTLGRIAGERWMTVRQSVRSPRRVRMVCLLERREGLALESEILPPSPLPLAPYMLGLPGDAQRERRRFARYADLMSETALLRLTCEPTDRPADLAELIEHALSQQPALALQGAR